MKEFRTTLDDRSARKVTRAAKRMGVTVPEYLRNLIKRAHTETKKEQLERIDREGYLRFPVTPDEFPFAEKDRVWPE
ncbi:MAG: hypothetical protein HUU46_18040 [Candidatus Hydrogenedentes bacterium]|nr:hypothetical protein [Candidatus Hydrogenedentota bacterium]